MQPNYADRPKLKDNGSILDNIFFTLDNSVFRTVVFQALRKLIFLVV